MVSTEKNSKFVSIQIPDNAEPGDTITFNIDGNELELEIPVGSKVGDVLKIQLAEQEQQQEPEEDEEEMEEISIELLNNKTLKLVQNSCSGGHDGTHGLVWPSGRFLIESGLLSNLPNEKSVLELGSGLGLIGLAYAATITTVTSNLCRIVLTDVPSSIDLLQKNATRNQSILAKGVKVETQSLDWSKSNDTMETFPIVLCSDLLYNSSSIPDLVATLQRCWNPENGCIVMAVRWRKPGLERDFFQRTETELGIEWQLYTDNDEASSWCPLMWHEFGDPNNENSNKYFSQTMISIGGEGLKSLGEITEHDVEESMSSEEFNAWERAFVQIYVGKKK